LLRKGVLALFKEIQSTRIGLILLPQYCVFVIYRSEILDCEYQLYEIQIKFSRWWRNPELKIQFSKIQNAETSDHTESRSQVIHREE